MMSSFLTARHYHLQENPEYTFLFAGEGSDYYHWVLYCHLYNVSIDQPPMSTAAAAACAVPVSQVQTQPHTAASPAAGTMPPFFAVPHVSPLAKSGVQAQVRVASSPHHGTAAAA